MIDPKYLKKRGVHSGPYKKIFTLNPRSIPGGYGTSST